MTKRHDKSEDGLYHIKSKIYKELKGSRAQVWNGTAYQTEGGLIKKDLIKSHGHIVSLKKHKTAKKEMRLQKYGYFAEKGKFGYVKKNTKKRRSSKKRGGALEFADLDKAYLASSPAATSAAPTTAAATSAAPTTAAATTKH